MSVQILNQEKTVQLLFKPPVVNIRRSLQLPGSTLTYRTYQQCAHRVARTMSDDYQHFQRFHIQFSL